MNQTILQVHAKAIEQLEAELGLNTGARIQQFINLRILIRDESWRVDKHDVPDKSVNDFPKEWLISQFMLRCIRTALAMRFFIALGTDGNKTVNEIWLRGSKTT